MSRFVGRVAELAALHEITDAAVEGGVAAAIVIGEPGSGKSRLLAEAAARAELSNRFHIVGYEPERHVPHGDPVSTGPSVVQQGQEDGKVRRMAGLLRY